MTLEAKDLTRSGPNRETVSKQIRRRKIQFSTVCLKNVHLKIRMKLKIKVDISVHSVQGVCN